MRHDGEDLEQRPVDALQMEPSEGDLVGLSRQISSARTKRYPSESKERGDDSGEPGENSD